MVRGEIFPVITKSFLRKLLLVYDLKYGLREKIAKNRVLFFFVPNRIKNTLIISVLCNQHH